MVVVVGTVGPLPGQRIPRAAPWWPALSVLVAWGPCLGPSVWGWGTDGTGRQHPTSWAAGRAPDQWRGSLRKKKKTGFNLLTFSAKECDHHSSISTILVLEMKYSGRLSHYLNQCWLTRSKVHWHSLEGNLTKDTSATNHLTHCGLVTPYDAIDLGQHWLR